MEGKILKCPECGSRGPFDIRARAWFSVEWDKTQACYLWENKDDGHVDEDCKLKRDYLAWCSKCEHAETVGAFGGKNLEKS